MFIVGLTGGIGAGKSTVADLLRRRGAAVVDVDAIGREVIAPGGPSESAVLVAFGSRIVAADGSIDRKALAQIVFRDKKELERLTAISHPAIDDEIIARLKAMPSDAFVVLDMAILAESQLGRRDPKYRYQHVVVVEAPWHLRIERAVARGMSREDIVHRMDQQASDRLREDLADLVIANDGSVEDLERRVDDAWAVLQKLASGVPKSS